MAPTAFGKLERGTLSPNALLKNLPILHQGTCCLMAELLSQPAKWFTCSASTPKPSTAAAELRTSSSSARKPKISCPADLRPTLETYNAPGAR